MIFGFVKVEEAAVITHRDSYLLANLSVVSVRRPYFVMAAVLGGLFAGFSLMFLDLLFLHEIIWVAVLCLGGPILGSQLGELKFVSRDLRGSELASVIYGQYAHLGRIRREIVMAMAMQARSGRP